MKLVFGTGSRFGRFNYKKASAIVDFAISNDIRVFDTAFHYGNKKSQPLLAKCLRKHLEKSREEFIISTKCFPESAEYIKFCVQESLEVFNTDYLDYFHLWGAGANHLERNEILGCLKDLIKSGKIRNACVTSQDLRTIKKISTGFYEEISGMLLDYNLLKQDRLPFIKKSKKNNIKIFAGTTLCQGFLLESIFKMLIRSKSPFYLLRSLFKFETKQYLNNSKILRTYIKHQYSKYSKQIPLSFVVNEPNIDYLSIGMLNRKTIYKNLNIFNKPLSKKLTNEVSNWALLNCQIKDDF